ncbi:ABC transporter permease [Brucella thiophenivorans]|uniref:Binding-protein-dependent transport system inner membrane component family protein n=1 Tax=Brucella thiophenivorans TaxID=571255 RepID=A0A256FJQ9_9HYPH|nr:ABC transporter permease [Brucella thiophenivorans]OYR15059.1 binding-protein-dependent transport system inner membrane component family protein [Brucella thiophenivorans]
MPLPPLLSFALRRILQAIPVILLIMIGSFLIIKLAPGDTVDALVGDMGGADPQFVANLRAEYGLDQPVWMQLLLYMSKILQLDFGWSYVYELPVWDVLMNRLVPTLLLMVSSLSVAFIFGVALGAIAARRAYTLTDNAISTLGLIFYAMPSFFFSLLLMLVFSVKLGWLPVGGLKTLGAFYSGWDNVVDIAIHLIMPTTALALIYLAFYMRLMRTSVLEVEDLDYIRTARAKGASGARLMFHHIIRNALLPVVTLLGLQFSTVLGGSVVIETIFSLPGLGQLAYMSVIKRDINTLMGIIFLCSVLVIIVNFITDLIYARLDSRIELS